MFRRILVPVDLSGEPSEAATTTVIELARGWGASLEFIHVIPGYGSAWVESFFPADLEQRLMTQAKERMKAFLDHEIPQDVAADGVVAQGSAYERIIERAEEVGADLIVVPAQSGHRQGDRWLLGPNAARVARHAPCSVLLVRC
jgi:nucleotide-binding universal stress UspA family protein